MMEVQFTVNSITMLKGKLHGFQPEGIYLSICLLDRSKNPLLQTDRCPGLGLSGQ